MATGRINAALALAAAGIFAGSCGMLVNAGGSLVAPSERQVPAGASSADFAPDSVRCWKLPARCPHV